MGSYPLDRVNTLFSIWARGSWDRIPMGARFSTPVQTIPGAHPASYTMGTGSFPGIKRLGRGVNHPPPSSTKVERRVELYICSPSGPLWPVLGRILPLTLPLLSSLMLSNSTKILLLTTLIRDVLVSVSCTSRLGAWIGLEINVVSFIPLISNVKNMYHTETSLKYFVVQVLASATLLFMVVIKMLTEDLFTLERTAYTPIIICTPLLLKSGAVPLHWWFPGVMEGLNEKIVHY